MRKQVDPSGNGFSRGGRLASASGSRTQTRSGRTGEEAGQERIAFTTAFEQAMEEIDEEIRYLLAVLGR